MKKYFLLTVLSLLLFLFAHSQVSSGIRAGGNFTNIIHRSKVDKFKPGFHAGAYLEYNFTEKLSFQSEAVYSVKGYRSKYSVTIHGTGTYNIRYVDYNELYSFSYIDIPFLLNITFGKTNFYVGLGPQLSYLVSSKWNSEVSTTTIYSTGPPEKGIFITSGNNSKELGPLDVSAVLGFGSKFDSGIEYCLRAGYGITNVYPKRQSDYHNLVFTVTLGYTFIKTPKLQTTDDAKEKEDATK